MTKAFNHEYHAGHVPRGPGRPRSRSFKRMAATTGAFTLTVLIAGCGSSNHRSSSTTSTTRPLAKALVYTRCMRSHGVQDFPDPTTSGGGITFQVSNTVGSNPAFTTANRACQSLRPGGQQAPTMSARQIAAEVRWAHCMRLHGVPSFPDPNSSGAIDSAKFDPTSPAFQRASAACKSLQPSGAVSATPGTP
jgi:hypothetical protein